MCTNARKFICVSSWLCWLCILIWQHAGWFCVVFYIAIKRSPCGHVASNKLSSHQFSCPSSPNAFLTWCLKFNGRNMFMFSVYWLCSSCSSLSHACTHQRIQIHTEVLWSGKSLKLCTSPTSFTLCNTNNAGWTCTVRTHKESEIRGEEMKGAIWSNVAALNKKQIYSSAVQLRVKLFFSWLSCWELAEAH